MKIFCPESSVISELSDRYDTGRIEGWVLYDAGCSFCTGLLGKVEGSLRAAGFRPEALQAAWVRERLKLPEDMLLAEMRVLTREGRVLGGADAVVYLAGELVKGVHPWWACLLWLASKIPFGMPLMRSSYRWVAARRYCRRGACGAATSAIAQKD